MYYTPEEVKRVLYSRGVRKLYHANTVATSLSFLRAGGLLSRGYAEDIGTRQTPQQTDATDQEFGIYYDIFFDASDIHHASRNLNHYGPVAFVYSIDILDLLGIDIRVTKRNPMYWDPDLPEDKRYFTDAAQLDFHYDERDFGQHITLRDMRAPLPSEPYLQEIILEDPQILETKYFAQAVAALSTELDRQQITAPLIIRECPQTCGCHDTYRARKEGFTYYRFRTVC